MSLKAAITEDMKTAMRAKDAPRLSTIRLLLAAIKQREVDERKDLTDADIVAVIEKMLKQRRDSVEQYTKGNRKDLADVEEAEIVVLQGYMPKAMSDAEVDAAIIAALATSGAKGMADMGKLMAVLKPHLAGKADMGKVSALVKAKLSA
ncbi:MAG TPA: GatB/YqeY domain-containing protein [Burkholderiales bacterium]